MGKQKREKDKLNSEDEVNVKDDIEIEEILNKVEQDNLEDGELTKLKEKYDLLQSKLLRTQADYDNFRKRTSLEKEELARYINGELIKELLPACDNFDRALVASRENSNYDSLLKGIEMVYKQIKDILESNGLAEIDAIGKQFNPEYHQALMQVEHDGEAGIVLEEIEKGFTYKGKVIRPSMVKVSG